MTLPDAMVICQDPPNLKAFQEMEKLLLIILGAAVQCSQKEQMIALIKSLPFELQHAFVDKIKEVQIGSCCNMFTIRNRRMFPGN